MRGIPRPLLLVPWGRRIVPADLCRRADTTFSNAGCTISKPWTRGDAAAAVTLAIAACLFAPATGLAQHVDIGFSAGFYVPVGALVKSGSKSSPATFYEQRLQGTPTLGANVTVWTSHHLGFAGTINFSPSDVALSDTAGTHDYASLVMLASARGLYAFSPLHFKPPPGRRDTPWSFYVGAGVGLVSRSGAVWNYSTGLTAPALLLDVGVRTAVGGRAVLRFDIEDYISVAQFDKGLPTETEARTHNDLIFSLSVAYRVVR